MCCWTDLIIIFLGKTRILKWLDIIYTTILIFTCMTQFVGLESGWLWLSRVSQTYLDYDVLAQGLSEAAVYSLQKTDF